MCTGYAEFIKRIDRKTAMFYLDPPYWDCEKDYGKSLFEKADFERLAKQLADIKGRFIMSINDVPQIRDIFAGFEMEQVSTTYSVARSSSGTASRLELLISNFCLSEG